jgi:hypothetical protein
VKKESSAVLGQDGFFDVSKLLHCGVYALLRRGEVVYIGKSKQPLTRLYAHANARGKRLPKPVGYRTERFGIVFDAMWFRPCMLGQLDALEVEMIRVYQPRHNVKDKPKRTMGPGYEIPEDVRELLAQIAIELPPSRDTFSAQLGRYMVRRL